MLTKKEANTLLKIIYPMWEKISEEVKLNEKRNKRISLKKKKEEKTLLGLVCSLHGIID